jgi:hypothetical protein
MIKSRFTETKIVGDIRRQDSGVPTKDIRRQLGIPYATFYNWKAR